jgi:hypothetical protein
VAAESELSSTTFFVIRYGSNASIRGATRLGNSWGTHVSTSIFRF